MLGQFLNKIGPSGFYHDGRSIMVKRSNKMFLLINLARSFTLLGCLSSIINCVVHAHLSVGWICSNIS